MTKRWMSVGSGNAEAARGRIVHAIPGPIHEEAAPPVPEELQMQPPLVQGSGAENTSPYKIGLKGRGDENWAFEHDAAYTRGMPYTEAAIAISAPVWEPQRSTLSKPSLSASSFASSASVSMLTSRSGFLVDNPHRRCPIIEKARTQLGYCPSVSLEEGLRRSLIWYRDNQVAEEA